MQRHRGREGAQFTPITEKKKNACLATVQTENGRKREIDGAGRFTAIAQVWGVPFTTVNTII